METMTGTPKQIEWAQEIRGRLLPEIERVKAAAVAMLARVDAVADEDLELYEDTRDGLREDLERAVAVLDAAARCADAEAWIEYVRNVDPATDAAAFGWPERFGGVVARLAQNAPGVTTGSPLAQTQHNASVVAQVVSGSLAELYPVLVGGEAE